MKKLFLLKIKIHFVKIKYYKNLIFNYIIIYNTSSTVTKNLINLDNNKITKIARISEGLERKKNPRSVIFITSKY